MIDKQAEPHLEFFMLRWPTLLGLLLALLLTACSGDLTDPFAGERAPRDRILLWHTWDAAQSETLNAMLTAYQDINPNTKVISVAVAEDSLLTRIEKAQPCRAGARSRLGRCRADLQYG